MLSCDRNTALIISEGVLNLKHTPRKGYFKEQTAEISLYIPKFIKSIELIIVHSDNFSRRISPSLNTNLKVYATKTGNESGFVALDNPEELHKKSHVKMYRWAFKRKSMEGEWTFLIKPETTVEILDSHRKDTFVRFGCAILVTSKPTDRLFSVSEDISRKFN